MSRKNKEKNWEKSEVIWVSVEEKKNEEVLQVTVIFGDEEERLWSFRWRKKGAAK